MIAAYCWPQSATHNQSIELYCHTSATHFQFKVSRQGTTNQTVFTQQKLVGRDQGLTEQEAACGCDWTSATALMIDATWPSGFYLVNLEDSDGNHCEAFFIVRASEPADALLVLSTSTWNAYNTWGGASLYTGGHVVSPRRPLPAGFLSKTDPHKHRIARFNSWPKEDARAFTAAGYDIWSMAAGWANWELLFVRWAESQGYNLGFAASQDLDQYPDLLDGYSAYLSVGHDEYWSAGMRDNVENYLDAGGHAAFFSGNTAFWQVRFSNDYAQMRCHKFGFEEDPLYDPTAVAGTLPRLSTMWSDPLVGRPENHMTGVSFTRGGYAQMPNSPAGTGGYRIRQPDHWALNATGLGAGELLGAESVVVGYECDGCVLDETGEQPRPVCIDGTPENFDIIATAPARLWETEQLPDSLDDTYVGELNWVAQRIAGGDTAENRALFDRGHAVLGSFKRGTGEVFTTGCTDWAYGLEDTQVAAVTHNVLQRFIHSRQAARKA